jgi:hypothetical protein
MTEAEKSAMTTSLGQDHDIISAAPMKTRTIVLAALSRKNFLFGSPLENFLYHFKLDDKTAEIYNVRS